jgi:hypothetical protein
MKINSSVNIYCLIELAIATQLKRYGAMEKATLAALVHDMLRKFIYTSEDDPGGVARMVYSKIDAMVGLKFIDEGGLRYVTLTPVGDFQLVLLGNALKTVLDAADMELTSAREFENGI